MKTCARKILKSAACLFVALAAIASCKPDIVPEDDKNEPGDGPGTEDKEDITAMVDSVENVLYRQVRAMQLVLTDADLLVSSSIIPSSRSAMSPSKGIAIAAKTLVSILWSESNVLSTLPRLM